MNDLEMQKENKIPSYSKTKKNVALPPKTNIKVDTNLVKAEKPVKPVKADYKVNKPDMPNKPVNPLESNYKSKNVGNMVANTYKNKLMSKLGLGGLGTLKRSVQQYKYGNDLIDWENKAKPIREDYNRRLAAAQTKYKQDLAKYGQDVAKYNLNKNLGYKTDENYGISGGFLDGFTKGLEKDFYKPAKKSKKDKPNMTTSDMLKILESKLKGKA